MTGEMMSVVIEGPEVQKRQGKLMRRLERVGFSIGESHTIPVAHDFTFLALSSEGGKNDEYKGKIAETGMVLKELNDGTLWMATATGMFGRLRGKIPGLDRSEANAYNFGTWAYLFKLGEQCNLTEEMIKEAFVQQALNPSQENATLQRLVEKAAPPAWMDRQKSTPVELLAASFVANDSGLPDRVRDYLKREKDGKIEKPLSFLNKASDEIELVVPKMPALIIPLMKWLGSIYTNYAVIEKITKGTSNPEEYGIYRSGLIRVTSKGLSVIPSIAEKKTE